MVTNLPDFSVPSVDSTDDPAAPPEIEFDAREEGILDVTPPAGFDDVDDGIDGRSDVVSTSRIPVLVPRDASVDAGDLTDRQKRELKKLNMPSLGNSINKLPNKRPSKWRKE